MNKGKILFWSLVGVIALVFMLGIFVDECGHWIGPEFCNKYVANRWWNRWLY